MNLVILNEIRALMYWLLVLCVDSFCFMFLCYKLILLLSKYRIVLILLDEMDEILNWNCINYCPLHKANANLLYVGIR